MAAILDKLKQCYVYALCEPDTGVIRYVGRAVNAQTRYRAHLNDLSKSPKARWIQTLQAHGKRPLLRILETCTGGSVVDAEKRWIAEMKRNGAPLLNSRYYAVPTVSSNQSSHATVIQVEREALLRELRGLQEEERALKSELAAVRSDKTPLLNEVIELNGKLQTALTIVALYDSGRLQPPQVSREQGDCGA